MIKKDPNRSILKDHKREGKKLIPPLLQIPKTKPISFRDKTLPCLIWISALFVRNHDVDAARKSVEFLQKCNNILGHENTPLLVFLNNFNKLSCDQKKRLCDDSEIRDAVNFIWDSVCHQSFLFDDYPLNFLFEGFHVEISKEESIDRLKEDVVGLLDKYCEHATKVQVTAVVSMVTTRRFFISRDVNLSDPNIVFTAPDSDNAKMFAAFTRSILNMKPMLDGEKDGENEWSKSFWYQIFKLEGCQ